MRTTVIKVQRPLTPPGAPYLMYDENRSHVTKVQERDLPVLVCAAFLSEFVTKRFFIAEWIGSEWCVIKITTYRKW